MLNLSCISRFVLYTPKTQVQHDGVNIRTFDPELTDLQQQILTLLKVPVSAYCTVA
jgi:hypothetical protein